jgi:hypothetical protein
MAVQRVAQHRRVEIDPQVLHVVGGERGQQQHHCQQRLEAAAGGERRQQQEVQRGQREDERGRQAPARRVGCVAERGAQEGSVAGQGPEHTGGEQHRLCARGEPPAAGGGCSHAVIRPRLPEDKLKTSRW